MSTRSNIGIVNADGTVLTIYCHNDGYPSGVGQTLLDHYVDEAKVRELLALGDISILGEVIGEKHDFDWTSSFSMGSFGMEFDAMRKDPRYKMCLAYGRDRGEKGAKARKHKTMTAACAWCDNDYAYIFTPSRGVWSFRAKAGPFKQLTPEDCKE